MLDQESNEHKKNYLSNARALFAGIVLQAKRDVYAYKNGIPGTTYKDYKSSIDFFSPGGGMDYYMENLFISDWRYTKLQSEIMAITEISKTKIVRKIYHHTCKNCNNEFETTCCNAIWCPTCKDDVHREACRNRARNIKTGGKNVK